MTLRPYFACFAQGAAFGTEILKTSGDFKPKAFAAGILTSIALLTAGLATPFVMAAHHNPQKSAISQMQEPYPSKDKINSILKTIPLLNAL